MKTLALVTTALLLLTAVVAVAPTAEATCRPEKPSTCEPDFCLVSLYNDPDCLVRNPCDPRYCDPFPVLP